MRPRILGVFVFVKKRTALSAGSSDFGTAPSAGSSDFGRDHDVGRVFFLSKGI